MTARSLADALRGADDETLAELLGLRPELVSPVPADLSQLAARATTAPSVARALDRLDRWTLHVLEAACAATGPGSGEPADYPRIANLLAGSPEDAIRAAIDRLLALALLWGQDDALHVVVGAREIIGNHPAGLGPALDVLLKALPPARVAALLADIDPAAAGAATSPDDVIEALAARIGRTEPLTALLSSAPPQAMSLLERLTWGPPIGAVDRADRDVTVATATSAVDWLLARGLLVGADSGTVVLPREVSLHLRGGRAFADAQAEPPPAQVIAVRDQVDRTAGGQAFTFIRLTEDLLETWGLDAPPVLKAGGLGVRELRRAALLLDVEEWQAALVIETAYAAGLIGPSADIDDSWLPTPGYDSWRADPPEERWAKLAEAWLRTTRLTALVGTRDDRDRVAAALGPDLDRMLAPEVRVGVLGVLAEARPGSALAAGDIEAVLAWRRPRRPSRLRHDIVGWTLREAEELGVTGQGALSSPGRALVGGQGGSRTDVGGIVATVAAPGQAADAAADALAPLLPQPLDHVLLQADLTAIAPGPLVAELAHALALMADVESTGGATVYRFTDNSVRRALDAGRAAADLHTLLARHSSTGVPQPLTYLIDDIARRHGRIRVGAAAAYVRCDDEGLLAQLLADKRSVDLRLRRLAPTVLAAQAAGDVVLERLRAKGFAPAAESSDGAMVIRRPDSRRAAARQRPPRLAAEAATPSAKLRAAAVRALRAGDRAASAPRGQAVTGMASVGVVPRTAAAQTVTLLQLAVDQGRAVWIGYVDQHGSVTERVVDPIRLEGGYLTGYDHRYEEVRTFAMHRITGVAALESGDDSPDYDTADVSAADDNGDLPNDARTTDVRGPA